MELNDIIRYIIAGELTRDYIVLPNQSALEDVPGGDALYSALGLSFWDNQVGIISHVSQNYPQIWLDRLYQKNISTAGIQRSTETFDQRHFMAYPDFSTKKKGNPTGHYARINQPFPKELLGYNQPAPIDRAARKRIILKNIPEAYFDASTAHICPMDITTQQQLIYMFKQENISRISLRPHSSYMEPTHWDETHDLFKNVSTLIISESKLRTFFRNRIDNLETMIKHLAENGSDIIVILMANQSQVVYDHLTKKSWQIPQYPFARSVNPTGIRAAFAGGFLAGYRQTYHALEAALMGNISASVILESKRPFDAFDFLPELKQERLHVLRTLAKPL